MGYRDWSERHGNPFPWLLVATYAALVMCIVLALGIGAWCSVR